MGVGVISGFERLGDVEEAAELGAGAMREEEEASVEEVVFIA